MKQRLLVMNGQRLIQTEQDGQWITEKVEKAGMLRPGIYNLYLAQLAGKSKTHNGLIMHVDAEKVYQQVDRQIVGHTLADFSDVPAIDNVLNIKYVNGKAVLGQGIDQGRARKRSIT